jgi:hypothetical protein
MIRFSGVSIKEDGMRKALFLLLVFTFAFAGYRVQSTAAQEKAAKAAAEKEGRWHGLIIRFYKDASAMDVRKANDIRKVYFDSSTKWTEGKKTIDMSEFKEGFDVICLGKYDEKGILHATRVDLRRR